MQSFVVDAGSAGKSLIRVILNHYPAINAGLVFKALRQKDIRINGKRQHSDMPVTSGDIIVLYIADELLSGNPSELPNPQSVQDDNQTAASPPYQIVYQDKLILIVSKRPGITVHSAADGKDHGPVLIDLLRRELQEPELELCHRLDRQTGGLIMLTGKPAILPVIRDLMQKGSIVKRYRCLVRGRPEQGRTVIVHDGRSMFELTAWLEKDAAHSDVYIHDQKQAGDLPVITRYRIIRVYPAAGPDQEDVSELEVELVTGRTHQIRAHLAHIGHPLLGDGKYGRNSYNRCFPGRHGYLAHQQLFATSLAFLSEIKGPLAYLAGRTFCIEPDYEWPATDKPPPAIG